MKVGVVVAVVLRCSRSLTNVVGRGAEDDQCQALLRVLHKPTRPEMVNGDRAVDYLTHAHNRAGVYCQPQPEAS
jgi:hypothetical protein